MNSLSKVLALLVCLGFLLGLSACEEGPMEKAGRKMDEAFDKAGDELKKAGDKMKKQ
jgi:hypothetical protein